jgi:galactoside O-acetyltransferase
MGFRNIGNNVQISDKCSIYGAPRISVGSNVRIDDFCLLSAGEGGITIGNNIHIACYTLLMGQQHIELQDYVGLSSRVSVYSSTDDYTGGHMTNPTIPDAYKKVVSRPVLIKKHVIVGSGSVLLPGVVLEEGASVGALSLVNKRVPEYTVVSGSPLRKVCSRPKEKLLSLEKEYENSKSNI